MEKTRLRPYTDQVLIWRRPPRDRFKSGIEIPKSFQEKAWFGRVLEVGPAPVFDNGARPALELAPGDEVMFGRHVPVVEERDGGEVIALVLASDVKAVMRDGAIERPLYDRVLIRRDKPMDRFANGLLIPPSSRTERRTGTVLAVGPGRLTRKGVRVPVPLSVGDRVVLKKHFGCDVIADGDLEGLYREEAVLFSYEDIL